MQLLRRPVPSWLKYLCRNCTDQQFDNRGSQPHKACAERWERKLPGLSRCSGSGTGNGEQPHRGNCLSSKEEVPHTTHTRTSTTEPTARSSHAHSQHWPSRGTGLQRAKSRCPRRRSRLSHQAQGGSLGRQGEGTSPCALSQGSDRWLSHRSAQTSAATPRPASCPKAPCVHTESAVKTAR